MNDKMINVLHKFIQLCFDSGQIPQKWSQALIVPIPKSSNKDSRIPLNYRGISLLCTSAKLYSSILNKRLISYLEENNSLVDEQNGTARTGTKTKQTKSKKKKTPKKRKTGSKKT